MNMKHTVLKQNNRAFKKCKENNNQYHWISVIWFQKWLLSLKFELNFTPILHINHYTSLIYMFKNYFEVWMNYNTLTLNTYKVKLVLINILLKIVQFKELAHLQQILTILLDPGGNIMVCPAVYTIISVKLFLDFLTRYIRL